MGERDMKNKSPRGLPLIYQDTPLEVPVVTVEDYCKWYSIFVVDLSGHVTQCDFPDFIDRESSYVDHVPNPAHVERWARNMRFLIDGRSLVEMQRRWKDINS